MAVLNLKKKRKFSKRILDSVHKNKMIGILAGTEPHRFIGIWAVVVEDRVFVRSWSLKARSWYRTFLKNPLGFITVDSKEIAVRATQIRSDRIRKAVDVAYLAKYNTPGSIRYAKDLGRVRSRETTTELLPR
jgi:hypothetical protein